MAFTRRQVLQGIGAGAVILGGGVSYLDNEDMPPASLIPGKTLCDLHAHLPNYESPEETIAFLQTPGLVGLAHYTGTSRNLTYEQAIRLLQDNQVLYQELSSGNLLATGQGMVARTQEIVAGDFHVLAVGWEKEGYFPDEKGKSISSLEVTVKRIHDRGGRAILNHPAVRSAGWKYRPSEAEEFPEIRQGYALVDEVEVHNAQCIDLVPVVGWMKEANRLALRWLNDHNREHPERAMEGWAASDAGRKFDQAKITGNYVDTALLQELGIAGLITAIDERKSDRFTNPQTGPYVSRGSWIQGRVIQQLVGGRF